MEHGHAGGNLYAAAGSGSAGSQKGDHSLAVRPDQVAGCEGVLTERWRRDYRVPLAPAVTFHWPWMRFGHSARSLLRLASKSKRLARSNKSPDRGQTTKKRIR